MVPPREDTEARGTTFGSERVHSPLGRNEPKGPFHFDVEHRLPASCEYNLLNEGNRAGPRHRHSEKPIAPGRSRPECFVDPEDFCRIDGVHSGHRSVNKRFPHFDVRLAELRRLLS